MKSLIITLILLLSLKNEISNVPDKFLEINYENFLKSKRMVFLSQIVSDVQYIQLETNSSCLINNLRGVKFSFTDSLIFVQNGNHVLKFSIYGKFIEKIGNSGRGPGEIMRIMSMSVIPDKKLLVLHQADRLMYFSFNGNLIKTIKIPYHQEVKIISDSRYITYDPGTNGSEKYNFILANDQGDTISTVKNYVTWEKTYSGSVVLSGGAFEAFYFNKNSYFFKSKYNDTVYYVNAAKDKIEPSYSINFGKHKVPDELIPEKVANDAIKLNKFKEKAVDFYWGKPFEASNNLFIRASCMGKLDIKYLLYDKKANNGSLLVNEVGESTGILNDVDGGMDFWPVLQKTDYELIMPVEALEFKKLVEGYYSSKRPIKYPEKQKRLKSFISGLDEFDNPILMVVTLKK